jgi:hypothetical protein
MKIIETFDADSNKIKKYTIDMLECNCGSKYSSILKQCPNCKR